MNIKKYFPSLLCIALLALAPACTKKSCKKDMQDEIKTTIELDTTVFELEETDSDQKVIKF